MTPIAKISTILFIFALTLSYGLYEKSKISKFEALNEPILKEIPDIKVSDLEGKSIYDKNNLLDKETRALMVHFWGTWCAPCEAELPAFVELAEKLESMNVKFLLLAVNDDVLKIKKFLKRFKTLPGNIVLAHDSTGESMPLFGTVKVPETYLFSREGKNLNKFTGPQDWNMPSYFDRIKRLVENSFSSQSEAVETH